jgi:hypothetical protein
MFLNFSSSNNFSFADGAIESCSYLLTERRNGNGICADYVLFCTALIPGYNLAGLPPDLGFKP